MARDRQRLNYENKLILAPMVRVGTLPMRLLALDYGADIVYTEELIDFRLLRSIRRQNDVLGTIDYVDQSDGTIIFRTCSRERNNVVLQLGTCDPERAVKVARLVEQDVAAIDINMGCPKKFSIDGGMGAALLNDIPKAKSILKALVEGVGLPITCKIRIFENLEKTFDLCDALVSTGISAIAVHGRTVNERPQHPNNSQTIRAIAERLSIPVIANGGSREIEKYSHIERFKRETGCSSVMLARAAEWNCSIFRKEGLLPMDDVIRSYLKYAVDFDNSPANTKYCVQNIIRELQETPMGKRFLSSQTLEQICEIWDMEEYCRKKSKEYQENGLLGRFQVIPRMRNCDEERKSLKRKHDEDDESMTVMQCAFLRRGYTADTDLPKTRLLKWLRDNSKIDVSPTYHTWYEDKLFRSILTLEGKKYTSSYWEKNKKRAEQGAALVCLCALGVVDEETLTKSGCLLG